MSLTFRISLIVSLLCVFLVSSGAQEMCPPRPLAGSTVTDPLALQSQNGVLNVSMTMLNTVGSDGLMHYCYMYDAANEAPALFLNPGDTLNFTLTNHLTGTSGPMAGMHSMMRDQPSNACGGGNMDVSSTNVHFHGLNIPPKCHQDEVIKTTLQPNDPPFLYSFKIPANDPPGLYWYHPHVHGFTTTQVLGGAVGPLIINGAETIRPETAGLPERVLVIRQLNTGFGSHKKGQSGPPPDQDTSPLSLNFVPAFIQLPPPVINMKPGERQLWRVVNATSIYFLALQLQVNLQPQTLQLVAVDGIPLTAIQPIQTVVIPPAGRAEFIIQGPPLGAQALFWNLGFDTGPGGDFNGNSIVANVVASGSAPDLPRVPAVAGRPAPPQRFAGLDKQKPAKTRQLFFPERTIGNTTDFTITVKGQTPKVYDPFDPPAIIAKQGTVEDWIIENHTTEVHAFHIHQTHFKLLEVNGQPVNDPTLRDTVLVPYWDGVSPQFTSIKVRIDFRDPSVIGTFLYHCHILDHEDGGMMAKIRVDPAN